MNVPITFEFKGKTYHGYFRQESGSGSTASFHLNVDGFFWGHLTYIEGHPGFNGGLHSVDSGWRFSSPSHPELSEQTDYFGLVIQQWLDSNS